MSGASPRAVVGLLIAQAFAFGVTLALLLVPANSLFLDAYGSQWLPVTYIAIALVGSGVAALIARAARGTRLVRVATVSLGGFAAVFLASWAILRAGGDLVSGVLLVMFPIVLQIGFVFVGGQAGRLFDVRQMKELFPRVVSGFALGFLVGGLLGVPLLELLGSTEDLLIATTVAQLAFLGLLLLTERRFPEVRVAQPAGAPVVARPPLRTLFSGLVALLFAYQLLAAMGSQVVDFLFFDRAAARYSGSDLTRFLATYTAALNLVEIAFLAVVAGPLMRRWGLGLGLVLNPAAVAAVLAAMAVVSAGAAAASSGLFALVGLLRITHIATTDGMTRTSINAAFQTVEADERLAVLAAVEGIGVPVAIGATGMLLLALDAIGLGVEAVIAFGLLLAVTWTTVAVAVHRSYVRALADAVRRRPLVASGALNGEAAGVRALLRSDDVRDVRLGLDLLAGVASPSAETELQRVAADADPEVRLRALAALAAGGDQAAATAVRATVRERLDDPDPAVRCAALDAVTRDDAADPAVVAGVVAAAGSGRTSGRAAAALARLGEAAVPPVTAALSADRRLPLVRAAAAAYGAALVHPALDGDDRSVVLAALEALDGTGGGAPVDVDGVLADAATLAARALAARSALDERDAVLVRALDDEVELARRLAIAALALRHGDGVRAAVRVVEQGEGARRAVGVEALDVVLSRAEAAVVLPLVRHDLSLAQRAAALRREAPPPRSRAEWIDDVARDPDGVWRSPWLAACAAAAR